VQSSQSSEGSIESFKPKLLDWSHNVESVNFIATFEDRVMLTARRHKESKGETLSIDSVIVRLSPRDNDDCPSELVQIDSAPFLTQYYQLIIDLKAINLTVSEIWFS
jgi:hypothetical protein